MARRTTTRARAKVAIFVAAAHAALGVTPSVAFAQSSDPAQPAAPRPVGDDKVFLKDGGMMRGTLVDVLPGAQARIQLVTGEVDTVPWQEIARIERGGASTGASPEAPSTASSDVLVHIKAPAGVVVQQDVTNADDWKTVCTAPCDRPLSPSFHYRVTGGGIRSSNDFTLQATEGSSERLVVDASSQAAYVLGILGMAGGVVVGYVGVFVWYAGALSSAVYDSSPNQGTENAGLALMGVGALAAVGGLVLALSNGKTKVLPDPHGTPSGSAASVQSVRPSPEWHALAPAALAPAALAPPPFVGIPAFALRF